MILLILNLAQSTKSHLSFDPFFGDENSNSTRIEAPTWRMAHVVNFKVTWVKTKNKVDVASSY